MSAQPIGSNSSLSEPAWVCDAIDRPQRSGAQWEPFLWGTSRRVVMSSWAGLCLRSLTNPTHIVSRLGLDAQQASAIDAVASRGPLLWQAPRFPSSQPSHRGARGVGMLMRLQLQTGSAGSPIDRTKLQWRNLHTTRGPAGKGKANLKA